MQPPPVPVHEEQRLRRLYQLDVLDTPAEPLYDDITRLASLICKTTYSTVSLIDRDRQWFKARNGNLEIQETSREISFCGHTILQDRPLILEDVRRDPRFRDNPFVTGEPWIRFYAGVPLITSDGFAIGTLCVFDPESRALSREQEEGLRLLATQVISRLEKRVEDALNYHIGDILDASDLYVMLLDLCRDSVLYTNKALERRLSGLPSSAMAAFAALFPQLTIDGFLADNQQEQTRETRVHFNDGDEVTTDVRLINHREPGRHHLLIIVQDQAALRASRSEAEQARSNLRLFSQAAQQSLNLILITDASERITWVNRSFEKLTGYPLKEVIGRRPGDLLNGPDTPADACARIRQQLKTGLPVREEMVNYSRDGKPYWVDVYVEPLSDDSGRITHYVASQTDITERKEQERMVREARDAAERASRAKSEFLTNISHELRTPLNGIMGVAELLQDDAPEPIQPYVHTLSQSSRHLLRLLNDILDLSYIESGHMKLDLAPMSLMTELREVAELFQPRAAESGTRLTIVADGIDELWLMADATRIKQVIMNLVGNAVKFTEQGEIRIEARIAGDDSHQVTLELAVADTGPGIPLADQKRIFEYFEQLDNSVTRIRGGSGLGLAISRQLLQLMGGELLLESKPGSGSRFYTSLTLQRADKPAKPAAETPGPDITPLRSALIIDDNAVNRRILKTMLEHLGTGQVFTAGSGRRGLAMLENVTPDMVFVDIQMPGMDGFEFLHKASTRFAEENRSRPVMVACTAHSGPEHRQRSMENGFDAHLEKPVTRATLRNLINQLSFAIPPPAADPTSRLTPILSKKGTR
ncbi:ATP-binding protein [uncultured Marinobacter sp.]|uniref:ATP-binding protein n=1 Tax=uncultured Marinobacter sp. TaxID=187379 RepID=UPI0030D8EF37